MNILAHVGSSIDAGNDNIRFPFEDRFDAEINAINRGTVCCIDPMSDFPDSQRFVQGNGVTNAGPFPLRRDNTDIACFDKVFPERQKAFGMNTVIVGQKD
jgi:hypothetical protein